MNRRLESIFQDFERYILNVDYKNPDRFKKTFLEKINQIVTTIEKEPDKKKYEDRFFEICSRLEPSIMHRRARQKPLGYPGDYLIIDWIYTHKTAESGIGKFYDELFHSYKAAQSVLNRKEYFIKKCSELVQSKDDPIDILSLGCGSCRDIVETYEVLNDGEYLHFDCIDHEAEAIEYASHLIRNLPFHENIHLSHTNVLRLKAEDKYDLIWSAGLFDYLKDGLAIMLLKKMWRALKEDGRIIFGNFSPYYPEREGMEFAVRWKLIHRNVHDLVDLCNKADIPFSELEVDNEPLGINLFCVIRK